MAYPKFFERSMAGGFLSDEKPLVRWKVFLRPQDQSTMKEPSVNQYKIRRPTHVRTKRASIKFRYYLISKVFLG